MKYIFLFTLLICSFGCTTIEVADYDYSISPIDVPAVVGKEPLTNIEHVYVGMSIQDVNSIMGNSLDVGYQLNEKDKNVFDPIKIASPYKKETLKVKNHKYEVMYYYIQTKDADSKVSDDELMPLIFEGDKLIGKDQEFLLKIKK
jgi:hypothetical protein